MNYITILLIRWVDIRLNDDSLKLEHKANQKTITTTQSD